MKYRNKQLKVLQFSKVNRGKKIRGRGRVDRIEGCIVYFPE